MAPAASFKQSPYSISHPPLDGSLFLTDMVEFNAKHNTTRPFYTFYDERTSDIRSISHLEFYRASQRIAHAVRPSRQGPDNEVVAMIAYSDTILYQALTMGLIYAGLVPFPMSPRNSSPAVANMMQKTGCCRLIVTQHSLGHLVDGIRTELASLDDGSIQLRIEEPPALAYAYPKFGNEAASVPFVPYPKAQQRPVNNDIMYYLHSSGSTGFPKPIPITYGTAVHWCLTPSVLEHVDIPIDIRIGAASLPSFHTLGMYIQLFMPIASLKSVSVYAPTSYHDPTAAPVIPNSENAIESVQLTNSNALVVVPAFLEEWVTSAQAVKVLSSLQYVVFAGGPLGKKTGDALVAAGVKLSCVYGATEFCAITYTFRNPIEQKLWEWTRFGPNSRIRWAPQSDGTYECQVLTCPTHQVSVENLPDVKGYATSDAFVKHPTIQGLYKVVGRLDDVLTLSSGEKTVPAPMENVIKSNRFLSGICMFGHGHNQVGVLVEPRPEYAIDVTDDRQVAEFRNRIWPEVEEANGEAPKFSRIFREMILVTSKGKPMLRAGKGTVIKKATMKLYESEIEALYGSVETSAKAGIDIPLPSDWSQIEVENWLIMHATAVNSDKPVQVDVDLFEQGFDSLSSTFLKNGVIGSLGASSNERIREAASRISQNIVFSNPTIRLLARYLIQLIVSKETFSATDAKTRIEDMIAKYSVGLGNKIGSNAPATHSSSSNGHVRHANRHAVLLTGSTGGLGSYLLASLLGNEDVTVVYASNRPSRTGTIKQRQRAAFEDRGLETALLSSEKLVYVEGDAAQQKLGIDHNIYEELRDSLTVIIHNAWRLDFNLSLSSFEPNIRGTRNLIDLALSSKRSSKPRFLFTSSIASTQGWGKRKGAFPEEVQYDASVAVGAGYGASKYVCERLLVNSGLPTSSFRIGQISGGVPRGAWSTTDWVPIIVKSSVTLGALPEARGVSETVNVTSWLPPHAVSDAILDVAFAKDEPPIAVNLVHPRPVKWVSLMKPISSVLYQKSLTSEPLPLVPFGEWVTRLEKCAANMSEDNIRRLPAIKLLNFMRFLAQEDTAIRQWDRADAEAAGFTDFAMDVAQRVSKTMRELEPLSPSDAARWVDYWESIGMFSEAHAISIGK
ncbi:acetyl-CoA synthetase-like protein [Gyrodon lividus]|nr:acetyl-CoA synthetase-like protein [Gyrodon lividus]